MNNGTDINPRNSLWRDAAADWGVIGSILFVVMLLNEFAGHQFMSALFFIEMGIMIGGIFFFTRKRSLKYPDESFSIGQGMSYILAMMVFTGFITGIGSYLAFNFISPDYYQPLLEAQIEQFETALAGLNNPTVDYNQVESAIRNPIIHLFSGILGKIIGGAIVGLFVSFRVKRQPISGRNE